MSVEDVRAQRFHLRRERTKHPFDPGQNNCINSCRQTLYCCRNNCAPPWQHLQLCCGYFGSERFRRLMRPRKTSRQSWEAALPATPGAGLEPCTIAFPSLVLANSRIVSIRLGRSWMEAASIGAIAAAICSSQGGWLVSVIRSNADDMIGPVQIGTLPEPSA